ncbi:MAG: glycosyltransferase [Pseudomonadales bacterium]
MSGIDPGALRVAVVSDARPERNGVGTYYNDLIEHLEPLGVRFELYYPGGSVPEWLNLPLIGDNTQRAALPSPRQLARRLRAFAPTCVITPTPGPYGMLGAYLGRRLGARVLVTFHTDYHRMMDLYYGRLMRIVTHGYFHFSNRVLFRYGSLVLANSERVAEAARKLGADEVQLMGTLIARAFLERPMAPPRERMEHVLYAGRLAAEKNVGAVLEAARALPDLRFSIAGDGPEREPVLRAAASLANVEYLGWLERGDALAAMDDHDLLVLPSSVESFGTVALEAMARGRAVLVSPGCGIVEWPDLRPGVFVMTPEEPLHEAIARLRAMTADARAEVVGKGRAAASALNDRSLEHWLSLLGGSCPEVSGAPA